ncbi:branched-chain amino acid ABC transporter permease [Desulfovirgula thermocuniculi]|uniref:branched-chain amino acid ABC transporter permease n=1 Tax=Desulfovirgula thermocuniculi TaxID=348842 RepID=UPI000405BAA6|nr:branched-chain amino acid ABC transporter permease [Desulfovirgula thermocuniculi]
MFLQQVVNGIVVGSVYALTALGATLVYGILRILDISNAAAYATGAYIAFFVYSATGNLLLSFAAGVVLTALLGLAVQRYLFAPLMEKPPLVSLIASIGLFICTQDLLRLVAGPQIQNFHAGGVLPNIYLERINLTVYGSWVIVLLVTAALLAFLYLLLNHSAIGLAWRATAQDLETTQAMGINTNRVIALNFLLGYGFAAAAGIMVGIMYKYVFPTMGDVPAYKMLAVIVLGGLGNPLGTVLAAMIIGLAETLIGGYIGFFLPRDALAFVILILILLWRPQGLLGRRQAN